MNLKEYGELQGSDELRHNICKALVIQSKVDYDLLTKIILDHDMDYFRRYGEWPPLRYIKMESK